MRLTIAFLAAAVLGGCASPGYDYELRVDPSASLLVAQQAAWGWEEATRREGQPRLEVRVAGTPYGCSGRHYCVFLEEVPRGQTAFSAVTSSCSPDGYACTLTMPDTQSSHTRVSTALDDRPQERLAAYAHELGHALGLDYQGGHVLMNCPRLDQGVEGPTDDDVEQFYRVRGVSRPGFAR